MHVGPGGANSPHLPVPLALLLLGASRDAAQLVPDLRRRRRRVLVRPGRAATCITAAVRRRCPLPLGTAPSGPPAGTPPAAAAHLLLLCPRGQPPPLPPAGNLAAPDDAVELGLVGLALVGDPQFAPAAGLDGLGGQEGHLGGELAAGADQGVEPGRQAGAGRPETAEFGLPGGGSGGGGCTSGGVPRGSRCRRRLLGLARHGWLVGNGGAHKKNELTNVPR